MKRNTPKARRVQTRTTRGGQSEIIRDSAFARRLEMACDTNPHVPPLNSGRLTWFVRQFKDRLKEDITVETVRKWFVGVAHPRPERTAFIAELLGVDEVWLSMGVEPDMQPQERRVRNAVADGAVNYIAALIQLHGGVPAYPEKEKIGFEADLTAIIRGGHYYFDARLAFDLGKGVHSFKIPNDVSRVMVLGVIPKGGLNYDVLRFDTEGLRRLAERKGGYSELRVVEKKGEYATGGHKWAKVTDFGAGF